MDSGPFPKPRPERPMNDIIADETPAWYYRAQGIMPRQPERPPWGDFVPPHPGGFGGLGGGISGGHSRGGWPTGRPLSLVDSGGSGAGGSGGAGGGSGGVFGGVPDRIFGGDSGPAANVPRESAATRGAVSAPATPTAADLIPPTSIHRPDFLPDIPPYLRALEPDNAGWGLDIPTRFDLRAGYGTATPNPKQETSDSLDSGALARYDYDPSQPWMTADIPRPGEQLSEKLGRFVFWPIIKHYVRNRENPEAPIPAPENDLGDWIRLKGKLAILHRIGVGAEQNQKWTTRDGHGEAIYDANGQLVRDPANVGTYNHYDPIQNPMAHALVDVVPYLILGNSPQDPTTVIDRRAPLKTVASGPSARRTERRTRDISW